MSDMVGTLCERQAKALTAVVDRAEFLEVMAIGSAVSSSSHWYQEAIARRREREAMQDEGEGKSEDRRYLKERHHEERESRCEKDGRRRAHRQDKENRRDKE